MPELTNSTNESTRESKATRPPCVVGDIMTTDLVTLYAEDNLERVEEGMERFGIRHLPVVDDGKLVGLVSHRDVLRVAVSILDPTRVVREQHQREMVLVQNIMSTELTTASPQMPVTKAARLLHEQKIGCLPIVKDDGTLLGIVTESDFLQLVSSLLGEEDAPS